MKVKKFIYIIILTLIIPIFVFASGKEKNTTINKDYIAKVKKVFNIKDSKGFNISEQFYNDTKIYDLYWEDDTNVSISDKGDVLFFSKYSREKKIGKKDLNIKNYIKKSEEILNSLNPNLTTIYKFEDIEYFQNNNRIKISYARYENGIPVSGDYINFDFDIIDQSLQRYYRSEKGLSKESKDFPSIDKIISLKEAQKIFKEKEALKEAYYVINKDKGFETRSVYLTPGGNKYINALDKSLMDFYEEESEKFAEDKKDSSGISPVENTEIEKVENLKNVNEIIKKAKLDLAKGYKLVGSNTYKDFNNKYVYDFTFENNKKFLKLKYDAESGNLIGYNSNYPTAEKNKLKNEEALKISKDFINKYVKDVDDIDFKNPIYFSNRYTSKVTLYRTYKNRPVEYNGIDIEISNKDKKVINMSLDKYDLEFKDDFNKLSLDEAYKTFFEKDFKLYYIYKNKDIVPVYGPYKTRNVMIDVEKKALIDFEGKEIFDEEIKDFPNDLKILKDLKISLPKKSLEDKISAKEFTILLNKLDGNDIYSENLLRDKSNLDKKINYEDASYIILSYLGYRDLEKIDEEIFNTKALKNINKAEKDLKKYLLIARGLGIINEDIEPKDELTYEDALRIIFQIINI